MSRPASGHRAVAHTADVRVQAWAPTRERCIAEAVLGTVAAFLDTSGARATGRYRCQLTARSDEDLLVAVLDEVIYLLDTAGAVPVDVELDPLNGGVDVDFTTADAAVHPQLGSIPKGVSLHELSLTPGPGGWSCLVTLDV